MDVGDRLPSLELPTPRGKPLRLRSPTDGAPVLLFPPGHEPGGGRYGRSFAAAAADFRRWDGRPILVVASSAAAPEPAREGLAVVVDAGGQLRRRVGLDARSWGLLIADRWGVLYHVARGPEPDGLPRVAEIQEWLKFLATQCPECGVIDEPVPSGWNPP